MNEVTIKEVKFVDEVREYGNGFRKQEVVVETGDGRWDNPIAVEFTKDNIEKSQSQKRRPGHHRSQSQRPRMERSDGDQMFTSIAAYKVETEGGSGGDPLLPQTDPDVLSILRRIRRRGTTPVSKSPICPRIKFAKKLWRGHRADRSGRDLKTHRKETLGRFLDEVFTCLNFRF